MAKEGAAAVAERNRDNNDLADVCDFGPIISIHVSAIRIMRFTGI